jgi:1-deoxy-D-xylulose-5-phosphate synthase
MAGVLDKVDCPSDLESLSQEELEQLAGDIRKALIETVSRNGGHLASNLGVVELTIALHRVFCTPQDKIVWDVGHQSYAHKLLTGRKEHFNTLRQFKGLSGFPLRTESPHDAFGAGHAGTSISAALGMALARDLSRSTCNVVAVIGDGSMGSGMALEAISHAGHTGAKLIVVLNDNGMSISPSIGVLYRLFNHMRFDPKYGVAKKEAKKILSHLPLGQEAWEFGERIKSQVKRALIPSAFWEQFGVTYLGLVDGHNLKELQAALRRARDNETGPVLIHILTQKGKGHSKAEANATRFHSIAPPDSKRSKGRTFSQVFSEAVIQLMERNSKVVAISAAMLDGTGLAEAADRFPRRVFDVGICEQHAVTLGAGLASQGFIPIVAIYSTFLQRAYDQIVHDVCLQNLPVIFAIDRAGIVGDDGRTHQGVFDISYLRSIPQMIVSAPKDENELRQLMYTATLAGRPFAIRYPRGVGSGAAADAPWRSLPVGKWEVLREGDDLVLFAVGSMVGASLAAAERLKLEDVRCSVVNCRFAKPLDIECLRTMAGRTNRFVTVEENAAAGGFGSSVLEVLAAEKMGDVITECIALPDTFIDQGPQDLCRSLHGLDCDGIVRRVKQVFPELTTGTDAGSPAAGSPAAGTPAARLPVTAGSRRRAV